MMEEHVTDLLGAYVLGSLDDDERVTVTHHLSGCADCQRELAAFRAAADLIPLAVAVVNPPPELKQKVMGQIAARQSPLRPPAAGSAGPESWFARMKALFGPRSLGWVAAALLFVALLASNLFLWRQLSDLRASTIPLPADRNMLLVRMTGTDNAPQTHGYLVAFQQKEYGTLVVENAPPLDPAHQYQLWLIKDGKRTSGGVFSVDQEGYGTLQVYSEQPLTNYPTFGVTIEPVGGSPGPTGKKVLGGGF